MPWKVVSTMSQRQEFVALATQDGANIAQLARRFGVSRPTAYKWLARQQSGGIAVLADRSRRPKSSPAKSTDATERLVLEARDLHPVWGARKLRQFLIGKGHTLPAISTVNEILRRHQRLGPRAGVTRDCQRFEHPSPNDLWQMDFKGHVGMTDNRRCHPLTVLDDHSRYALGIVACLNETFETVQQSLTAIFRRYGMPARMLMDNGPPWGDQVDQPLTVCTIWLIRLGIRINHGRPYHPQTQGKDERFHRTLKAEVLERHTLTGIADAQRQFDVWKIVYNTERPHQALDDATPVTRYRSSPRSYPETLPPIEYDSTDIIRQVQSSGRITHERRDYRLSKALVGQDVALRPTAEGLLGVWFGCQRLGTLDPDQGVLIRRWSEDANRATTATT